MANLAVFGLLVLGAGLGVPQEAAPGHRIAILDAVTASGPRETTRIIVFDVDSEKIVASAVIGLNPDMALSPDGETIGAIYDYKVGGFTQPHARLIYYRARDLTLLSLGLLPVQRTAQMDVPRGPRDALSPSGKEIVVQLMRGTSTDERPSRQFHECLLNVVGRAVDGQGLYRTTKPETTINRCQSVIFLRVADWPRVAVWNFTLATLDTIDLSNGKRVSRLSFGLSPKLNRIDLAVLEKPKIGNLDFELGARGGMHVSADGRFAYYAPLPGRERGEPPGHMKKIDLAAKPPEVVKTSAEAYADIDGQLGAVAEKGGFLFVVKDVPPVKNEQQPSNRLVTFSTAELTRQGEIHIPVTDIHTLAASRDGKYVYAVDRDLGKLAVVEVATQKVVKVISTPAKRPSMVLALP